MRIALGIVGAGLLVLGLVKLYNAFFGEPGGSSAARQLETKIRGDFQARGQQVGEVRMTAQDRDRMTGHVTAGNPGVPGSDTRYDCTATRDSGSYFRYQCVPVGAPVAAAPLAGAPAAGVPAAGATASGTPGQPEARTWRGSYSCGQGNTGLEVTLRPAGQGRVEGTLSFFPLPTNAGVARGCYRVSGQADAARRTLDLRAGPWVRQPAGYHTVDLRGTVDPDGGISGQAIGAQCTVFWLRSAPSPMQPCP